MKKVFANEAVIRWLIFVSVFVSCSQNRSLGLTAYEMATGGVAAELKDKTIEEVSGCRRCKIAALLKDSAICSHLNLV